MANDSILLTKAVAEDLDVGVARVEVPAPSGGYVVGNQINLSTFAITYRASWTPGTIASGSAASTLVTVPGAALGFPVLAAFSGDLASDSWRLDARVSAANTVLVQLWNETGSSASINAATLTVLVFPIPGA